MWGLVGVGVAKAYLPGAMSFRGPGNAMRRLPGYEASVRRRMARIVEEHPDLVDAAIIAGLQAKPPYSAIYLRLLVEQLDGRAVARVEHTGSVEVLHARAEELARALTVEQLRALEAAAAALGMPRVLERVSSREASVVEAEEARQGAGTFGMLTGDGACGVGAGGAADTWRAECVSAVDGRPGVGGDAGGCGAVGEESARLSDCVANVGASCGAAGADPVCVGSAVCAGGGAVVAAAGVVSAQLGGDGVTGT